MAGDFLIDAIDHKPHKSRSFLQGGDVRVACTEHSKAKPPVHSIDIVGAQWTGPFNPRSRNYAKFVETLYEAGWPWPPDEQAALHALQIPGTLHSAFMDFESASVNVVNDLATGRVDAINKRVILT